MFVFLILVLLPQTLPAREPTVGEIQEEAIRYLGFDQREMEGWKKKARWSTVLPRLQIGFERDLKDIVSLTTKDSVSISGGDVTVGPDENNFDQNFNQGTSFDVRAVWRLDELLFNRDSLAVSSERRDWIRERNRVLQEVTEAYFTRRRLRQELPRPNDPWEVREKKKLILDQASAALDACTGGWFSREIQK